MDSMRTPTRAGPGHLPGFLLGDSEPLGLLDSFRSQSSATAVAPTSPKDVEMTSGSSSPIALSPAAHNSYSRAPKPATPSGPPIMSLYDEVNNSMSEFKENLNVNQSELQHQRFQDVSEGHWVLVFGFPPTASAYVLSIFSQIGAVVESSFPTSGNWLFIKYSTRSDARKALSYDSRVINGNVMIGVREGENINQMRTAYLTMSSQQNSSIMNRSIGSPSAVLSPKIRSLGTPKRSFPIPANLDTSTTGSPASPSVVSKAIDILFSGW